MSSWGGVNFDQHQIVVAFANPVTVGGVTISSADGGFGSANQSVAGAVVTINLTNMADEHNYLVTLTNMNGTASGIPIPIGILRGDTNGDRVINTGDTLQTRNRSGQPTDATNFRSDVNVDGLVNSGDTLVVRARSGNFLP